MHRGYVFNPHILGRIDADEIPTMLLVREVFGLFYLGRNLWIEFGITA